MPIFAILYQATWRFFSVLLSPLNKGEKVQPPPFDVQRKHLEEEMKELNDEEAAYQAGHPWKREGYSGTKHES